MPNLLVIMSDSRPLGTDKAAAEYHSLAVFINAVYCARGGYDFLYYRTAPVALGTSLPDALRMTKRLAKRWIKGARRPTQERTCCYNPRLNEARSASWAKLIAVRDALELDYRTVVYTDSDCVFVDHETSLEQFTSTASVQTGSAFDRSCMGFLKNSPWAENLPCAGFFVVKNTPDSRAFLEEWWNLPNPSHGFVHDFEQSSLHRLFKPSSGKLCVWDSLSLVEQPGQFLRHVTGPQHELRRSYFLKIVDRLERAAAQNFGAVVARVPQRNISSLTW